MPSINLTDNNIKLLKAVLKVMNATVRLLLVFLSTASTC
jgi:hypothetical protein